MRARLAVASCVIGRYYRGVININFASEFVASIAHTGRSSMLKLRLIFAGRDQLTSPGRPMTRQETRSVVADGLEAIGAHTVSQPVLTGLGAAACRHVIIESKLVCETRFLTSLFGWTLHSELATVTLIGAVLPSGCS